MKMKRSLDGIAVRLKRPSGFGADVSCASFVQRATTEKVGITDLTADAEPHGRASGMEGNQKVSQNRSLMHTAQPSLREPRLPAQDLPGGSLTSQRRLLTRGHHCRTLRVHLLFEYPHLSCWAHLGGKLSVGRVEWIGE